MTISEILNASKMGTKVKFCTCFVLCFDHDLNSIRSIENLVLFEATQIFFRNRFKLGIETIYHIIDYHHNRLIDICHLNSSTHISLNPASQEYLIPFTNNKVAVMVMYVLAAWISFFVPSTQLNTTV